jgi:hypothetical protein
MTQQRQSGLSIFALRRRLPSVAVLLFALCWASLGAAQPPPCLKLVFNKYCLGGDVNALAQQQPPVLREDHGERVALIYSDSRDRDYVLAWRGSVYKVLREHRIASQLQYEDLYRLLREKYGEGQDQSSFPAYARTPGRKQISIRRGEGRAVHVWETGLGWRIELSWTRETGLALAYIANDLDNQQSATRHGGY